MSPATNCNDPPHPPPSHHYRQSKPPTQAAPAPCSPSPLLAAAAQRGAMKFESIFHSFLKCKSFSHKALFVCLVYPPPAPPPPPLLGLLPSCCLLSCCLLPSNLIIASSARGCRPLQVAHLIELANSQIVFSACVCVCERAASRK